MSLVALLAMAPKPKEAPKTKEVKKEPKEKNASAEEVRKQQANMLTQLSKSTDPDKQGVLASYRALPRFSEQKK